MPAEPGDQKRRVIPRWLPSTIGTRTQAAQPLTPSSNAAGTLDAPRAEHQLNNAIARWRENKKPLYLAQEVVEQATAIGATTSHVLEAALQVAASRADLGVSKTLARRLSDADDDTDCVETDPPTDRGLVRQLKDLTRADPRDSLAWIDLGLAYANLGQARLARRAVEISHQLSPNGRLLLRSSSRFFVHIDEPDRGLAILRSTPRLQEDPWLMAAEISTATVAAEPSAVVTKARRLLGRDAWEPSNSTELASAIATVELESGALKRARKLFTASLDTPTENALAQAEWASKTILPLADLTETTEVDDAAEARALSLRKAGLWKEALDEIEAWSEWEPFSSRPPIIGSYIAAVALGDYRRAMDLANAGLQANPRDAVLLNNLAYSASLAGELDAARSALARVDNFGSREDKFALLATRGLLLLRSGEIEAGIRAYEEAIEEFERIGDPRRALVAELNLLREKARIRQVSPESASRRIQALPTRDVDLEQKAFARILLNELSSGNSSS